MDDNATLRGRSHLTHTPSHWRLALLLVASLLGCGGVVGSGPPQPPPSGVSVAIAPASASVPLGGTQSFAATVSNTANSAVTWSVNGIPGGNAALGSVNSAGLYTAPQILMAPPSLSLTATSAADPSKSGSATIALLSSFSISLAGPSSVSAGSAANYSATLTPEANSHPSPVIFWSVSGAGCTGVACGSISPAGVYTAPPIAPSPASVEIQATPQADPSKAATLSVAIIPVIHVVVSPVAASVPLGSALPLQATVSGSVDASVTWFVNGIAGGNATIGTVLNSQTNPDSTLYTAPAILPSGGSVTVLAKSNADPAISAGATITLLGPVSVSIFPASASVAVNERQTLSARVSGLADQNVTWSVNNIVGGNAAVGHICMAGSNPCGYLSAATSNSVDYIAPAGVPIPNAVTVTATSEGNVASSASAKFSILPHILVTVQPGSAALAGAEQMRFSATIAGTQNQQVVWSATGNGCPAPGTCGEIDASGLFSAPASAPSPNLINITATSLEDVTQAGTATVTITNSPRIFSLAPASAYAGSDGGFTLLATGNNFSASDPGPGATIIVSGVPRITSCPVASECFTSLDATDLQIPGNLAVQIENPDGSLSNSQTFVVLAPGSGSATIPLTPGAPASAGNDIVVVELSTNGGSGAAGNVSLNFAAVGPYSFAASSCVLGASPVVIARPASGTAAADLCVFSVSGLSPSFSYSLTGPPTPDITIVNKEPLGLDMLHLTLRVPASAATGPRTLFVENPEKDKAAATGAIEVR